MKGEKGHRLPELKKIALNVLNTDFLPKTLKTFQILDNADRSLAKLLLHFYFAVQYCS